MLADGNFGLTAIKRYTQKNPALEAKIEAQFPALSGHDMGTHFVEVQEKKRGGGDAGHYSFEYMNSYFDSMD